MTEDDYLEALTHCDGEADLDTLRMADDAVAAFPRSPRLWCRRGDLILLACAESTYTLADARESYQRALAIDPENPEALQELGHFFDAVEPQPELAEEYFRRAIDRGATVHAFVSLAELYLDSGRAEHAREVLSPVCCPYQDHEDVATIRERVMAACRRTRG